MRASSIPFVVWRTLMTMLVTLQFIRKGTTASKCEIDNIKRGYALKYGLNQNNVIPFGQADNLEACNELCCQNDTVTVGLFDGIKCYGMICINNRDRRCNLLRDGNTEYTIFRLLENKPVENKPVEPDAKVHPKGVSNKRKKKNTIKTNRSFHNVKFHNGSAVKKRNSTYVHEDATSIHRKTNTNNVHFENITLTLSYRMNSASHKNQTVLWLDDHQHHIKEHNNVARNGTSIKTNISNLTSSNYKASNNSQRQHTKPNENKFHRKHKKRRRQRLKRKVEKQKQLKSNSRFSRDYPYSYNADPGLTYSDLLRDSEEDHALLNKLLSDQHTDVSPSLYNAVASANVFDDRLPLQALSMGAEDLPRLSNAQSQRSTIYEKPLAMPVLHPQKTTLSNSPSRKSTLSAKSTIASAQKNVFNPNLQAFTPNKVLDNAKKSKMFPKHVPILSNQAKKVSNPSPIRSNFSTEMYNSKSDAYSNIPMIPPEIGNQHSMKKTTLPVKAEVKSLKEFPTDKDLANSDEKDLIPHPEQLVEERKITVKDSSIDVPFSTKMQLPNSPRTFSEGLLSYPQYFINEYHTDNHVHKQQHQAVSPMRSSHVSSNDASANIYALMYPLSTIQRKTYQKRILQSKQPSLLQQPTDVDDIEISDMPDENNSSDKEKQDQLKFINSRIDDSKTSLHPNIKNFYHADENSSNLSNMNDRKSHVNSLNFSDVSVLKPMHVPITAPSPVDVKKAIHEIEELKTQVEGLLTDETSSIGNATTPTNNQTFNLSVPSNRLRFREPINANHSFGNIKNVTLYEINNVSMVSNSVSAKNSFVKNSIVAKVNMMPTMHSHSAAVHANTIQQFSTKGCRNPIGISKSSMISDNHMQASSFQQGHPPSRGRLRIKENGDGYVGSWCADSKSVKTGKPSFLQVDIGARNMFCRTAVQGDDKFSKWVKSYKVHFSDDGKFWEPYREDGETKLFIGNEDQNDITYRTLKNPVISRFVRFEPVSWFGDVPCMRVELFNTSLSKDEASSHQIRSDIPMKNIKLIADLDFEKMDVMTVLDRSSFGNNGLLSEGTKVFDSHSSCRHAAKLPPGTDMVIDGSIMRERPREAITIALWVQLNKVEGVHSLFDTVGEHSNHELGQFHFEIVGGDVRWFHRNETEDIIFNIITDKKLIKPNEWNHIAALYDSATGDAVIYINGTEKIRGKGHGLISQDWDQRVGLGRHKGVRFLDGNVDEFKLYNVALEPRAVEELAEKCDFSIYYCGSTLTQSSGTIVSPSYPDTLPGPVQCVWSIEGKSDEVIVLDMKQFKLGKNGDCGKANLEVRDTAGDTLIGSYCGIKTPRKITSHSSRMYIKYFTDSALNGERFKIEYTREKKFNTKKTLPSQCHSSDTLKEVTLVGGPKAGNFTDLGYTNDMEDCKQRCCNVDDCEVAFMIDENCYSVKCANPDLCKVRRSKPSNLHPQIVYIQRGINQSSSAPITVEEPDQVGTDKDVLPTETCAHNPVMANSTLVGGIKAGNFTSRGVVEDFDECLKHCCHADDCDAAFMVKRTCFSLKCASDKLCAVRPAKPSQYHPVVAFLDRYKPKPKEESTGDGKALITQKTPTCNNMRVSKIYSDVTLKGGIGSGDFTDKGHVKSMEECIDKCCGIDTCNVAFVIKETCFVVRCKSYDSCGLKSAVSEYYNPKIAYINWNPPKNDLGEAVSYTYQGCWRDFDITAFALPLIEGTDPKLLDPYKKRSDPVSDCASVSQRKGYKVFAIQNGGACFSGEDAEQTYKRYGKSDSCKNGKGGPFANNVYKSFNDGSVIALGCWADLRDRAFRRMEKNDILLKNNFETRADPIGTCAKVAEKMKMKYFALQKGGQCFLAKEQQAPYDKYSPSRKCKYGLGGQMSNDVYMLKQNFTTVTGDNRQLVNQTSSAAEASSSSSVLVPTEQNIENGELVYKEEISGLEHLKYVYKAQPPISNVTLASAINAGTFEDKGKMEKLSDCIKVCGESKDCDVAFLLSSQCFNVHCFSEESCKTKPAYSAFYNPQLSFVKHRVIKKPSKTVVDGTCNQISELENMTFVEGINAGNFSDMGHADSMEECQSKCCHDDLCHVAFKIQSDCYGVHCYSKESCKTRPAKNSALFTPKMTIVRAIKDAEEIGLEQKTDEVNTTPPMSATGQSTNSVPSAARNETSSPTMNNTQSDASSASTTKCSDDTWDGGIIFNKTLVGGIDAGEFRDHGQTETVEDCMAHCCSEEDCDLSFMIDKDCYTVRCHNSNLCKTRAAKPTTFIPKIAIKNSYKYVIDKSNLTKVLQLKSKSASTNKSSQYVYTAFISNLFALPDSYDQTVRRSSPRSTSKPLMDHSPDFYFQYSNSGINDAIDFVQDTVTELTSDKDNIEKPFNILYRGLSTTPAQPSQTPTKHVTTKRTIIPKPGGTTPAATSLSLTPSGAPKDAQAIPTVVNSTKHSCNAEPIIYNATLRLGMHSGLFTKLGHVKTMDDCIERCCRSSNADVAYMLGPFCFAVKCKRDMCKPSPAMFSDITSFNLNPAISFLNKDSMPTGIEALLGDKDILDNVFDQAVDSNDLIQQVVRNLTEAKQWKHKQLTSTTQQKQLTAPQLDTNKHNALKQLLTETIDEETLNPKNKTILTGFNRDSLSGSLTNEQEGTCPDSPITYNVTLRGGVHSGKFTELGEGIPMRECVGKCCDTPLCDVAFMFSDKCYAVGCYDEGQCQAVIAKSSSLNPKLAYVSKYRANSLTSLEDMPSGIGFAQTSSTCSVKNVKHGPIYTNRTLLGGMKAGNFSYLGHAKDIKSCLSKCCAAEKCDMAYLVNKQQCFSVKCFSPELCQVADQPFASKMIEISKLMKPKNHKRFKKNTIFLYLAVGLVAMTTGLTGFVWALLIFVKRKNLKSKTPQEDDEPKPDR